MKKHSHRFLIAVLFLLFGLGFSWPAAASTSSNVRGYARLTASNSYLSFNCFDDIGGGKFPFTFPIKFSVAPCTDNTHGVAIDSTTGIFSGQAWHYIYGYVNFAVGATTPDESWRSNCPGSCTVANGCSACLVKNSAGNPGTVYGYAQVVNLAGSGVPAENHGWIKLTGLTVNSYNSGGDGSFHGSVLAGNSPASIGQLNFNCSDDGTCLSDSGNLNWKTYIWTLWVGKMTAPNWAYSDACSSANALNAVLKWQLASGVQRAWEIIISNINVLNTSSPFFYASASSSAISYNCASSPGGHCNMTYGQPYYWWLRLSYSLGASDPQNLWYQTPWLQFDHTSTTSIGQIVNGRGDTPDNYSFKNYNNEFPLFYAPYMAATPTPLIIGTSSVFSAYAAYSPAASPSSTQLCDPAHCTYTWSSSIPSSTAFNPISSNQNTTSVIFFDPTSTAVNVAVTDPSGYYCNQNTASMNANFLLPLWQEFKVKKNAQ